MRHWVVAASAVVCFASSSLHSEPLSDQDRQRVLAHLDMTSSWVASEVTGLTAAQQSWKPAPTAWSITDVVEHLAVAEAQYWTQLKDSLTQPTGQKTSVPDEMILWYGIDRTSRQRTGEARVPTGRYTRAADALAEFSRGREPMRAFAVETKEDLRGRLLKESKMDVYQWLLMISTHAQRHILQIREIKATAGYPFR